MDWAAKQALISQSERHSPCIGVCKLDEDTGLCIGCARTVDEIAQWSSLDASDRFAIWEQLPERHSKQAKRARLMPLTPQEILTWAAATIENRLGAWIAGMPGALAEFIAAPDQTPHAGLQNHQLIGRTGTASFRLRGHEKMRAFAVEEGGPIVLGLPKARIDRHPNSVVTKLGGDADALLPDYRDHLLFDFGLGREFSRFCIRTNHERAHFGLGGVRRQTLAGPDGSCRLPNCLRKPSSRGRIQLLRVSKSMLRSRSPMSALPGERTRISCQHSWRRKRKSVRAWGFRITPRRLQSSIRRRGRKSRNRNQTLKRRE